MKIHLDFWLTNALVTNWHQLMEFYKITFYDLISFDVTVFKIRPEYRMA
ncbi:hypothetical protein [uncultured Dokdonia sp.]|nr:hypothetical protein [uncultured Dokdonia sp.]